MKNQLAIAPAINSATQPKPTKDEVLEAMAKVRIEQIIKEQKQQTSRRELLKKECSDELASFFHSNINDFTARFNCGNEVYRRTPERNIPTGRIQNVSVSFDVAGIPNATERKLVELARIPSYFRQPSIFDVKKEIRNAMANILPKSDRIQALIDRPESRKAIESMLKRIS